MRGLAAAARQNLDNYLRRDSRRPLAVGLSGGGDSLALTLMADAWARDMGRQLLILTVDHRLQPQSASWTATCAALADRLDRPFRALPWEGDKPATGLPAAARRARHRLLAEAAREAGARVILLGHTADDRAEAAAMRAAGGTTPDPRPWSASPVWPEGRGLFLLRPLLAAGRAELRDWLRNAGEAWIEDPANLDPRYARSRARLAGPRTAAALGPDAPLVLADIASERAGIVLIPRARLADASTTEVRRLVSLAVVCAGGGERLPASARIERAAEMLLGAESFVATLAGARIEAENGMVRIFREAGEARRGGIAPLTPPGVWDGRFEIASGHEVRQVSGIARRLSPQDQARLSDFPAAARGALPALIAVDGSVRLGPLDSLVGERLRAAAGLVQREPA